jgi:hypothetical protein
MNKDTLATIAGMVVAICSTYQTMMPPDTPWWARATLAAVAAALGMWTGTVAYRPVPPQKGH